jgi:hypothetical protein
MTTDEGRKLVEQMKRDEDALRPWINVADQLPPNGGLVETKIHDWEGERNKQPLRRKGRLWLVSDGSMYVYYTPTHWRPAI